MKKDLKAPPHRQHKYERSQNEIFVLLQSMSPAERAEWIQQNVTSLPTAIAVIAALAMAMPGDKKL